jgi:hypothetical protein
MGYNARNDEIRDNVTRMRREWEAQRGALATVRVSSRTADDAVSANGQKGLQQFHMTEPAGHGY